MWTRHHKKRRTGALIVPLLAAAVLPYFGFHAYHGDYGIYSKYRLEERIVQLEQQFGEVRARRIDIERRVHLLEEGSVERDMLDEHARRALNLAHPDEMVIMRRMR